MKHYALFPAALIASVAIAAGYTAPTDFRGHEWGAPLSTFGATTEIGGSSGDGTKDYFRPEDDLHIGDAVIERIGYGFFEDRFYSVFITFKGSANARTIKLALTEKYGTPERPNQFMDRYYWGASATVTILFDYSDVTRAGSLLYMYRPIQAEVKAKAKASANKAKDQL